METNKADHEWKPLEYRNRGLQQNLVKTHSWKQLQPNPEQIYLPLEKNDK